MNKPWEIIAELESDNSRLFKESVIQREAEAENNEFFAGVRLALDAMVTFGIKQVAEKTEEDGAGLTWESFALAITGFTNRTVTGNAARIVIEAMMKSATKTEWNGWYRRILIKDLRCGVSDKTINNVVKKTNPEYQVPVFTCQLAHDGANHEAKVSGEKLIEVKLDGVRVLTIVYPTGRVDQFSRNGKELLNFGHVKDQFSRVAETLAEPMVFDGEVMSSSFQDLMKQVHRKDNVAAGDAVLYLFDMLPLRDFEMGICSTPQAVRHEQLKAWFDDKLFLQLVNVQVVENELVDLDTNAGQRRFAEINATAIAGGYEGLLIKDPAAPYECKRSVAWLKQKPVISVDLKVVDLEEGTGKNSGTLGALVCEGVDQGKDIRVNVGSGLTDTLRNEIWSAPSDVIGQTVEILADAVTKSQNSNTYSLRFPRFMRFRDDK